MENIALFVSSCDKYQSVWYPYFELIKIYWSAHPRKIYLSTESKSYSTEGMDITVLNSRGIMPWSQRLIEALNQVEESYIIFSLEDFFLLGSVKQSRIDECLTWMMEDDSIGVCRLSTAETVKGENYKQSDFVICPNTHIWRVDTQIALWRKSFLLKVLHPMETPWQFEGFASKRSMSMNEKLLWFSPTDPDDLKQMIYPYYNDVMKGYNIGWGKWRPKNKAWFLKNGIKGVKFHVLGSLSEKDIVRRKKYLYCKPTSVMGKFIKQCYQSYVYADRVIRELIITGPKGLLNLYSILYSKITHKKK